MTCNTILLPEGLTWPQHLDKTAVVDGVILHVYTRLHGRDVLPSRRFTTLNLSQSIVASAHHGAPSGFLISGQ